MRDQGGERLRRYGDEVHEAATTETRPAWGRRLLSVLPQGSTLPPEAWLRRHRVLLTLLWLHALALGIYAYAQGYGALHSLLEAGVVAVIAAAATLAGQRRRLASALVALGLVTGSAVLVHLSDGFIEAHFHFFVMIALLTLYEDWVPFLIAAGYVLVHHGVAGTVEPELVFNHPGAVGDPWKWAGIHALFVAGAGAAGVAAWKLNEQHRMETQLALDRARESDRSRAEAHQIARLGGFEMDLASDSVSWSREMYEVFGLDPGEFEVTPDAYRDLIHPGDREMMDSAFEEAVATGRRFDREHRARAGDGSWRVIHVRGEVVGDPPVKFVGTCQDVTDRALAESEALQRAGEQAAVAELGDRALAGGEVGGLMAEATDVVARVLDADNVAVLETRDGGENFTVRAATGEPGDLVGRSVPGGHASQSGYTFHLGQPVVVRDWSTETRFRRSKLLKAVGAHSGTTVPIRGRESTFGVLSVQSRTERDFSESDIAFLLSVAHVLASAVERRSAEEEMRHQALHDPLTGLPNRNLFSDRLAHALDLARRHGTLVAVLFCDLDQFKLVNDSLGHEAGDELLAAVAPRIRSALRDSDTVARFGGDEFAILVEEAASERDATRVADRVREALARPFALRGRDHFVSATLGIAIGTGDVAPEALIRDADAAMYRAKERGRGTYELFDEVMRARAHEHLRIENDLQRALERDELEVHYQPVIELESLTVSSVEALLRWNHPERGRLDPGAFIEIAEESGLIDRVGAWVLDRACRDAAEWSGLGPSGRSTGISVNLSVRQIANPAMVEDVREVVGRSGIDPERVSLEITESALLDDTTATLATLERLKALGIGLVLDDFGTGFSSLGYLQRFEFDALKLDRAFISRLVSEPGDTAIVGAVTEMAKALGLEVVAEGVETAEQLERIHALGCGFAQGFLFSRPLPAEYIAELLPSTWPRPATANV
jgi:diguanylate cyclase (GGDEF)-like protein/PAS domain S-box-containing protein